MCLVFDKLEKFNIQQILDLSVWKNSDSDTVKYHLPTALKPPTGKSLHAPFEDADSGDLYMPVAKLTAFRVRSKERFISWIKAFEFRYHHQLVSLEDHTCTWVDKNKTDNGPIVEILIRMLKGTMEKTKTENKLLTFHIYPTKFLITAQGNLHQTWSQREFKYLKSIVDTNCDAPVIHENILTNDIQFNSSDTIYSEFFFSPGVKK